jgi:transcriptional regulator with XRE-family HTH domain
MTNAVDAHIGRRLRALREAAGQSRATLAAASGLDELTLAAIEVGSQRLGAAAMKRVVNHLRVDVRALFVGFSARRSGPGIDVEPEVSERHLRVQGGGCDTQPL